VGEEVGGEFLGEEFPEVECACAEDEAAAFAAGAR